MVRGSLNQKEAQLFQGVVVRVSFAVNSQYFLGGFNPETYGLIIRIRVRSTASGKFVDFTSSSVVENHVVKCACVRKPFMYFNFDFGNFGFTCQIEGFLLDYFSVCRTNFFLVFRIFDFDRSYQVHSDLSLYPVLSTFAVNSISVIFSFYKAGDDRAGNSKYVYDECPFSPSAENSSSL